MKCSSGQLKEFWEVVEKLGWTEHAKYKIGQTYLNLNFNQESIDSLERIALRLVADLKGRLNSWAATQWPDQPDSEGWWSWSTLGNDGFDDLCCQFVGEGKDVYNTIMRYPILAYERALDRSFTENFLYCFLQLDGQRPDVLEKSYGPGL